MTLSLGGAKRRRGSSGGEEDRHRPAALRGLHERHAELVEEALEELVLLRRAPALRLLLQHLEELDQRARAVEVRRLAFRAAHEQHAGLRAQRDEQAEQIARVAPSVLPAGTGLLLTRRRRELRKERIARRRRGGGAAAAGWAGARGAVASGVASSASDFRTSPSGVKCRRSLTVKGFLSSLIPWRQAPLASRALLPGGPREARRRPAPDRQQEPDVSTSQRIRAAQPSA